MENLFDKVTDSELKRHYEQFNDWERTGIISGDELEKMRDAYFEKLGMCWHTICIMDLLKTIAERWIKNSSHPAFVPIGKNG